MKNTWAGNKLACFKNKYGNVPAQWLYEKDDRRVYITTCMQIKEA